MGDADVCCKATLHLSLFVDSVQMARCWPQRVKMVVFDCGTGLVGAA